MSSVTSSTTGRHRIGRAEFLVLIAFLSALNAIAIDVMLPAFGALRDAFGLAPDATDVSLIVTTYLAGLGVGQYLYGPFTDAYGRKPVLYVGISLYLLGAAGSTLAPSLQAMVIFRFLWGVGAAGPRVISFAIVRDRYSGDEMSRVIAIVMAVFMIVPALAPTIGQAMLALGSWRYPFVFSAAFAIVVGVWSMRMRETLPPDRRRPLSFRNTVAATREVFRHRTTTGMMIALTFSLGAFVSYLGSGQLIFSQIYDRADEFAYWFGLAAIVMAGASITSSRLVGRLGSRRLLAYILAGHMATTGTFLLLAVITGGRPPFAVFFTLVSMVLVGHVMLAALANSLAMEDVGHIAGTASAVIGTVSMVGGSVLASLIDRAVSDSIVPFALGFFGYGLLVVAAAAWGLRPWTGRGRGDSPGPGEAVEVLPDPPVA